MTGETRLSTRLGAVDEWVSTLARYTGGRRLEAGCADVREDRARPGSRVLVHPTSDGGWPSLARSLAALPHGRCGVTGQEVRPTMTGPLVSGHAIPVVASRTDPTQPVGALGAEVFAVTATGQVVQELQRIPVQDGVAVDSGADATVSLGAGAITGLLLPPAPA